MDARKILAIQARYETDPNYTLPDAAFALFVEGCSAEEANALLGLESLTKEAEQARPESCICSAQSFETYGCTCQKRVQPG